MADEVSQGTDNKFMLFLSNNEVFVWDRDTVLTLRRKYRIVGSLIGSVPGKPRQNLVFSLPLLLQAEEVSLLLEKKIAILLVNDHSVVSKDTVKRFHEERKANMDEQIEKLKDIKKKKLEEFAEVIEEAREKKHEEIENRKRKILSSDEKKHKKQRCTDEGDLADEIQIDEIQIRIHEDSSAGSENNTKDNVQDCDKKQEYEAKEELGYKEENEDRKWIVKNENKYEEKTKKTLTSSENDTQENLEDSDKKQEYEENRRGYKEENEAHKKIAKNENKYKERRKKTLTSSENDSPENLQDSTLICVPSQHPPSVVRAREAKWTFPETEEEKLRYKVYEDLWEKGYFITQGSKFGGDYLVYPGDPFRFHSYFVVTIVPWKKNTHALDLVSLGRMGSSVKKTSVLVSVDCSGNVIYTSIQWPGFT